MHRRVFLQMIGSTSVIGTSGCIDRLHPALGDCPPGYEDVDCDAGEELIYEAYRSINGVERVDVGGRIGRVHDEGFTFSDCTGIAVAYTGEHVFEEGSCVRVTGLAERMESRSGYNAISVGVRGPGEQAEPAEVEQVDR